MVALGSIGNIKYYEAMNGTDPRLFQLAFHLCELFLLGGKSFMGLFDLLGRGFNISLELV